MHLPLPDHIKPWMKKYLIATLILCYTKFLFAQTSAADTDTAKWLQTFTVKAFEQQGSLLKVPAAVSVITPTMLQRGGHADLVAVINAQAGVKMEERSPGSYRINIRASSMRAPFGVRNVKVYYHGLPYTTPGGDSYFNQLGFYNFQQLEIIKGPASSMYGGGTGGVILINPMGDKTKNSSQFDIQGGAYGMRGYRIQLHLGSDAQQQTLQYQRMQTAGYRDHTAMRRDVLNWNTSMKVGTNGSLQTYMLFGDLFYETPGALNRVEFDSAPRMSRPRVGSNPSAVQAHAAVRQKTFMTGVMYQQAMNAHWSHETGVYAAYTQLRNPGIFNYSATNEPHGGGRSVLHYKEKQLKIDIGGELQYGFSTYRSFKNVNGFPDSVKTDDEVQNSQQFIFLQGSYTFQKGWTMAMGASINRLKVAVSRLPLLPVQPYEKKYKAVLTPRWSILKYFKEGWSVYASFSGGYAAPTLSELLPSSGILATDLEAERGYNIELGSRGDILHKRLHYDVNVFNFNLKQAIVVRRDAQGRDYFINAGATQQRGSEASIQYDLMAMPHGFLRDTRLQIQHTWYDFEYKNFKKGSIDYAGKKMPGVPNQQWQMRLEGVFQKGFYGLLQYQHLSKTSLNDSNADTAPAYATVDITFGLQKKIGKHFQYDLYVSGTNLTDQNYSLGFDLNASGGRYWNAAAGRSWSVGVNVKH